jgi:very-short-patch-repair endonuclease
VIILSVGYGYDEDDKISTNFGVLNRPQGWRRLNVAITRARQRIEVVSSIRAADVQDMGNESIRHLKAYLEYAERDAATLGREITDREGMTAFEQSVLDTIKGWNFAVRRKIVAAGQAIDLGVLRPDHPDEAYALGIEFDGPGYREIPSTRDRDRLREQELRDLGWHLHRVWSTHWYANQAEEAGRLLTAIQRAISDPAPDFGRLPSRRSNTPYRPVVRSLIRPSPERVRGRHAAPE